jgi:uncharacterized protein YuzE
MMACCLSFVLLGEAKIYKHPKADTLYLTIPSKVVQDSTFIFKKGDTVKIRYDPEKKILIVEPLITKAKQKK